MNPALLLQFMSQDQPWAFGLRHAIEQRPHILAEAPLHEAPFFARLGPDGNQLQVIGDDLEDCIQTCLDRSPFIRPVPEDKPTAFVNPPE
jgi:hypothetical protein